MVNNVSAYLQHIVIECRLVAFMVVWSEMLRVPAVALVDVE